MVRAPLIRLVSAWSGTGETPVPGVCVYVRLSVPDLLYEPNTPDMLKTALKNIETLKWIIQVRESCSTHPSHRQSEAPVDKSRHSMLFVKTPSYCNYHCFESIAALSHTRTDSPTTSILSACADSSPIAMPVVIFPPIVGLS